MILLTGASGFLGKHLLAALLAERGARGVVVMTSKPIVGITTLLRNGDIVKEDAFREAPFNTITEVIHAGAFIPKSAAEGGDWIRCTANILHTQSLLQALPKGVQRFINISTVDVYAPAKVISENSQIAPPSLYGHSKLYCEHMAEAWAVGSEAAVQNLRLGHIYGPGEEGFKKIIPESFKRILRGEPLQLWGDGAELRAFIYVEDAVNAILKALTLNTYDGPINIAGGTALSIRELTDKIREAAGAEDTEIVSNPPVGASRSLSFDNRKMRRIIGDERMTLEDGLRREWNHMKALHEQNLL